MGCAVVGSGGFSQNKQAFFEREKTIESKDERFLFASGLVESMSFLDLNKLHEDTEQEFNTLFSSLKKQPHSEKFWFYCYYCCLMLETYYRGYGKPDKALEYEEHKQQIRRCIEEGRLPLTPQKTRSLQAKLIDDFNEIRTTPLHVSKLHSSVSLANLLRVQIVFSRITVEQSLLVAREFNWFSALDRWLGCPVDVDRMVSSLRTFNGVFNALSVGVFATRFMLNAGVILKHTLNPSEEERSLSTAERFFKEVKGKHCELINDVVWATVNGVTNYAPYFGVSAPAANWILAGFLLFDAGFLMYQRELGYQRYMKQKAQYIEALNGCTLEQQTMLQSQLTQLDNQWQVSNAVFYFNVGAALLLMGGFSASLLLSTAAAPLCFFVGAVAVSMYVASPLYKAYQEACLTQLQDAIDTARNDLLVSLTKNTVMPMLLLTTLATSLPAGVVLTSLFFGYEYWKGTGNEASALDHDDSVLATSLPAGVVLTPLFFGYEYWKGTGNEASALDHDDSVDVDGDAFAAIA